MEYPWIRKGLYDVPGNIKFLVEERAEDMDLISKFGVVCPNALQPEPIAELA